MVQRDLNPGILELDIHGMTKYQAKTYVDSQLKKANRSVYRIRVVHGYHGGTQLKELIQKNYRNHPRVIRIECGLNQGITDLVLRDL
jgi:DNA-nicking Smr family endonuclease